jgi:hypothetical protein
MLVLALTINRGSPIRQNMSDFTMALERELHRLEGELERDPRFRRIKQLQQLLVDYRTTGNGSMEAPAMPTPPASTPSGPPVAFPPPRRRRVHLSKGASVHMAVQDMLAKHGTLHRAEILKSLVEQRLMGHEKNPMASLAAYLSDWKSDFAPDGHGNFTLKKSTEGRTGVASASH